MKCQNSLQSWVWTFCTRQNLHILFIEKSNILEHLYMLSSHEILGLNIKTKNDVNVNIPWILLVFS